MNKPTSRTVPELLREMRARDPVHAAVVDGERTWSYAAFERAVDDLARALLADGVERGDRVGILAGNRAEWLISEFAIMSVGAICVGLNTWSTAAELAYQLEHAAVRRLIIEARFRDRDFVRLVDDARPLAGGLPVLDGVIAMDDDSGGGITGWSAYLARGASLDERTLASARRRVAEDDVACLLYTSGSTALPKGVPLVHGGLIDNMWEIGERQGLGSDDRLWLAVSLFWSLACVNAVFALATHGATIVVQHHFDAGDALRLIERERATVFYGTPNMALALAERLPNRRRSAARSASAQLLAANHHLQNGTRITASHTVP